MYKDNNNDTKKKKKIRVEHIAAHQLWLYYTNAVLYYKYLPIMYISVGFDFIVLARAARENKRFVWS